MPAPLQQQPFPRRLSRSTSPPRRTRWSLSSSRMRMRLVWRHSRPSIGLRRPMNRPTCEDPFFSLRSPCTSFVFIDVPPTPPTSPPDDVSRTIKFTRETSPCDQAATMPALSSLLLSLLRSYRYPAGSPSHRSSVEWHTEQACSMSNNSDHHRSLSARATPPTGFVGRGRIAPKGWRQGGRGGSHPSTGANASSE